MATFLAVGPAHAQSLGELDTEPPKVDLQLVETGVAGDSQVFSATITDDEGVAEVVLYYRIEGGNTTYSRVLMSAIPGTSIYSVAVEPENDDPMVIEYYINAADEAGNRVVRGFAFDPLRRVLETGSSSIANAPTSPAATQPAVPSSGGLSTGKKILYGVLGVLAVGAIAAAAGGDSSDPEPPGTTQIPVTFVSDPPDS